MAKLYAELTSDKGGRIASKSGDTEITVRLYTGNMHIGTLALCSDGVHYTSRNYRDTLTLEDFEDTDMLT